MDPKFKTLTKKEAQIYGILHKNQNHFVRKQDLIDKIWGLEHRGPTTIEVHICNLRKKLSDKSIKIFGAKGHFMMQSECPEITD